jgi:hypothetical protein
VLFVLIVLSHLRRHIVHFNITEHPTAMWTAQQSSTHSRTTRHPGGCIATATVSTASASGVEWRAWASPKWSQPRRVPGRIRTRNA